LILAASMAGNSQIGSRVVVIFIPIVAACAPSPTPPAVVQLLPTATRLSQTATLEPTVDPTPAPIHLWASPGLPPALLGLTERVAEVDGRPVIWTEADVADVRIEPVPERTLTSWVYAVVAPFPTLTDEISSTELKAHWGGLEEGVPVYLAGESGSALSSVLGAIENPNLQLTPADELLALAWEETSALAIVPFEVLEPQWKVLAIDGQSPVRKHFIPKDYPLTVEFGLSGEPALMNLVATQLGWPATNWDPEKLTTVLMTGVTALVRGTAYRMELYGPEYPGYEIGGWIQEADLAHISHEAPLSERCPTPDPFSASLRFCASPEYLVLFEVLGVDLIELTGNHVLDYGPEAMLYSLARYRDLGFQTFGGGADSAAAREPALVDHNGNRLAFIGCNAAGPEDDWATETGPGALSCGEQGLLELISELRDQGRMVIFTYQWPESVSPLPLPRQVEAFRDAAEAGAVIVSGSQAHLPQSMEFHQGSFIHYGLGNLFFDQMHSLAYRQEFLDRHVFYDGRHISTELLTAMLEDFSQPRPMSTQEREQFLERIFEASGW
jgi:poly-gamma-glutamate synthesis protein (capsule biosynthesis protein)